MLILIYPNMSFLFHGTPFFVADSSIIHLEGILYATQPGKQKINNKTQHEYKICQLMLMMD